MDLTTRPKRIYFRSPSDLTDQRWGSVESVLQFHIKQAIKRVGIQVDDPADADILHLWRPGREIRKVNEKLIDEFGGKPIIVESLGTNVCTGWELENIDRRLRGEKPRKFDKERAGEVEQFLVDNADIFRVPSVLSKNSFNDPSPKSKIVVRPYGYDPDYFGVKNIKHKAWQSNQKREESFNVGFFGRIRYRKGFHTFVDAIAQLTDLTNLAAVVVGSDGGALNYIDRHEVKGSINYIEVDSPKDMAVHMNRCDLVVCPAVHSGFGLSVLEAMACGCFPIVSPNAGISYILAQYGTGNIIPAHDSVTLAQYIRGMFNTWNKDLNLFHRLQGKAAKVATEFSWAAFEDELVFDYSRLIQKI